MMASVDIDACCVVQKLVQDDMSMKWMVYCGSPCWCVLTMQLKVSNYAFICTNETLSPIVPRATCQFAKFAVHRRRLVGILCSLTGNMSHETGKQ
jgi:hypothetical protein